MTIPTSRHILKNTSFLTLSYIGQKILAFVYFSVLARFLGPTDIGKYVFAISLSLILSVLVDGGVTSVIIRDTARKSEDIQKTIHRSMHLKLLLALFSYTLVCIASLVMTNDPTITLMIVLAGVVMVFDSFSTTLWGIMRGMHQVQYESLAIIGAQIILISIGGFVLFQGRSIYHLVSALIVSSGATLVYAYYTVKKKTSYTLFARTTLADALSSFKESYQFALAGIYTKVYSYVDQIMLPLLASTAALGLYSVPYKITFALQFIPSAFAASLYPVLSHYSQHAKEKIAQVMYKSITTMLLISIPISAGVVVIAHNLVTLVYGNEFKDSILSLQILIVALPFVFTSFPIGSLLNGSGNQNLNTRTMAITMVINIALNAILIPRYAQVGASIAAVVSLAYLTIANYFYAHKISENDTPLLLKELGKIVLSAGVMALLVWASLSLEMIIVSILIGVISYCAMVVITGAVTKQDFYDIKSLVSKTS